MLFNFPKDVCAQITIENTISWFENKKTNTNLKVVRFVNSNFELLNCFVNEFDKKLKKKIEKVEDDIDFKNLIIVNENLDLTKTNELVQFLILTIEKKKRF
jgi:hypothetical protein